MPRTPTVVEDTQVRLNDEPNEQVDNAVIAVNALAAADTMMMDSFEAIKAIGRIEAMQFAATVAEKCIAETALSIKESKKYKDLPYIDADGKRRHVATFEEFCEVFLDKSARRVRELMSNYKALGGELYEQAEKLGFRQRDYNALKALPEDDRKLIAAAIEEENFEKALDMMQSMAVRHHEEKTKLTAAVNDYGQQMDAKDRLIGNKHNEILKHEARIAKLEHQIDKKVDDVDMSFPGEARLLNLNHYVTTALVAKIQTTLRTHINGIQEELNNDLPESVRLAIGQAIGLIISNCYDVAGDYSLEPQIDSLAAVDPAKQDAADFAAWQANPKPIDGTLVE